MVTGVDVCNSMWYNNDMDTSIDVAYTPGMDLCWSTVQVAGYLGTSLPRVSRAIQYLGLSVRRTDRGWVRLSRPDIDMLLKYLGKYPVNSCFTREEMFVLAVLWNRPFGVESMRFLSECAGISPVATGNALKKLASQGLVERTVRRVMRLRVENILIWKLNIRSVLANHELVQNIGNTVVPLRPLRSNSCEPGQGCQIPGVFRSMFWNADFDRLNTQTNARMIATRVVEQMNLNALAWAIKTVDHQAFRDIAYARGNTARMTALALNIANSRESR